MIEYLQHGRVRLAVHRLKLAASSCQPLLLLHGLGESSSAHDRTLFEPWPGPVHALDFTGHGLSTVPSGGGYTSEALMGDVGIALSHLGPSTLCGRGLGAYVALLAAGARPDHVLGAVLLDGPGLAGASPLSSPYIPAITQGRASAPDRFALAELATELRPPAYAAHFAHLAAQHGPVAEPLALCTHEEPDWLREVRESLGIARNTPRDALQRFSRLSSVR